MYNLYVLFFEKKSRYFEREINSNYTLYLCRFISFFVFLSAFESIYQLYKLLFRHISSLYFFAPRQDIKRISTNTAALQSVKNRNKGNASVW